MGNVDDDVWKRLLDEVDDNGDGQVNNYWIIIYHTSTFIYLFIWTAFLSRIQNYDAQTHRIRRTWRKLRGGGKNLKGNSFHSSPKKAKTHLLSWTFSQ